LIVFYSSSKRLTWPLDGIIDEPGTWRSVFRAIQGLAILMYKTLAVGVIGRLPAIATRTQNCAPMVHLFAFDRV
jgi:hypothetical protein